MHFVIIGGDGVQLLGGWDIYPPSPPPRFGTAVYINGLPNISNAEFVLLADDTNIFFEAKNRMLAYENANKILKAVHLYMLVNKLDITMSKCCFIDFKPDKNVIPDSNLCLKINMW